MRARPVATRGHRMLLTGLFVVTVMAAAIAGCARAKPTGVVPALAPAASADQSSPLQAAPLTPEPLRAEVLPPAPSSGVAAPGTYTVRRGDTLNAIAATYGTSLSVLSALNGLTDADSLQEGQVLLLPSDEAKQTVRHVVVAGDTLAALARRYNTSSAAIEDANPSLRDPERLSVGQMLVIPVGQAPAARTHLVRVGETVYRIAQQYGVTVDSIMAANGLADAAQLAAGSVLVIP